MAIMGRPPKPTALKVLEGNRGKRPLNTREPKPAPVVPSCPSWLMLEAKREWRRISKELERLGLLTKVDRAVLAGYCQEWARWKQAEEVIDAQGLTFTTPNGYVQVRPEVAAAHKSLQLMNMFGSQLGLSPVARTRLSTEPEAAGDVFDELMG
jgi:P27 family predicted phage terminase small subunit